MSKAMLNWVAGGAAIVAIAGTTLLVHGFESRPVESNVGSKPETTILVAQADLPRATYTAEQASRGKVEFEKECVECHGKDLRGGLLGGPPLRGVAFEEKYGHGAPAGTLFELMSGTMPPNAPGSYSNKVYADLMAYILKTNRYRSGAELPSDVDALYELVIDK